MHVLHDIANILLGGSLIAHIPVYMFLHAYVTVTVDGGVTLTSTLNSSAQGSIHAERTHDANLLCDWMIELACMHGVEQYGIWPESAGTYCINV